MDRLNFFNKINKRLDNQKGAVLVVVMAFAALMVASVIYMGNIVRQDVNLIQKTKYSGQAIYVAEAGINHALAKIKNTNFASRADFAGTLDTGGYKVTFSETGGRYLVTSVGSVGDQTETVLVEIENLTPTAMRYVSGAGNDIRINSFVANADIAGDIHANDDVYLKSGPLISWLTITGDVSATDIVQLGTRYHQSDWFDSHVVINGVAGESAVVEEGANLITFPAFDYESYEADAVDSGDYYSSDQTFDGATLSPGNGIVYIDGNVTFQGSCTINGGIVADNITVDGTLRQVKTGDKNIIIAKEGDIGVLGRLQTEEALVYAERDIRSLQVGAAIDINGILLARRDIYMWNFLTYIDYNYVETYPSDMGDEDEQTFGIVSWNQ